MYEEKKKKISPWEGILPLRKGFEQATIQDVVDPIITEGIRYGEGGYGGVALSRPVNRNGDHLRTVEGGVAGKVKTVVEGDPLPEIAEGYRIDPASD